MLYVGVGERGVQHCQGVMRTFSHYAMIVLSGDRGKNTCNIRICMWLVRLCCVPKPGGTFDQSPRVVLILMIAIFARKFSREECDGK